MRSPPITLARVLAARARARRAARRARAGARPRRRRPRRLHRRGRLRPGDPDVPNPSSDARSATAPTGTSGRDLTADIYKYFRAVKAATENNPRVRMLEKSYGKSVLGQDLAFWVLSTPDNIANLDAGRKDAAVLGRRARRLGLGGRRPGGRALAAGARPGSPPPRTAPSRPRARRSAATCTSSRPARTAGTPCACATWTSSCCRCATRTAVTRSSARAPGRSTTTATSAPRTRSRTARSCRCFKQYPGVFFIDAHQTGNGYFFPPNEDPVHHEISDFTVDYIGDMIGPALRQAFDDQTIDYFNYQTYDLFVPEYGDTVPSLLSGRRRHDVREGHERGLRQAGLRALPRDRRDDRRHGPQQAGDPARAGSSSGRRPSARAQGCDLEPNELVSPLTEPLKQQPDLRGLRLLLPARPPRGRHRRAGRSTCRPRACTSTRSTRTSTPPACASSARAPRALQMLPAGHAVHAA